MHIESKSEEKVPKKTQLDMIDKTINFCNTIFLIISKDYFRILL